MRCLYLKKILTEDENSQIFKFFHLQLNQPVKGDWVSTCLEDLRKLRISESLQDIKTMSENNFKKLIKTRIKEIAFEYLLQKRGSKGQGIKYSSLEMSEYLLPHNVKMDIDEKRRIFSLKNGMLPIPHNFGKSNEKCICGMDIENMPHKYSCENLNERKPVLPFQKS